jgi:hypothetical protein
MLSLDCGRRLLMSTTLSFFSRKSPGYVVLSLARIRVLPRHLRQSFVRNPCVDHGVQLGFVGLGFWRGLAVLAGAQRFELLRDRGEIRARLY